MFCDQNYNERYPHPSTQLGCEFTFCEGHSDIIWISSSWCWDVPPLVARSITACRATLVLIENNIFAHFYTFLHTWLNMNSTKTILLYFTVVLIREEKNYLQFFAVFI